MRVATQASESGPSRPADGALALVPFSFCLQASLPASLAALRQAMQDQLAAQGHPGAEPLRWAITGSDPGRGLQLEGVGLSSPAAGEH